jgi:16S rRNA (uracil1498-N3)-methyltransferase
VKQFILSNEPDSDNIVRLDGKDYRYLVRVRRFAVGEYFPALLPNGKETLVQILSIKDDILTGRCTEKENSVQCSQASGFLPQIILFQALPKGDKMDLIVRQAAEGGVTEIVPFVSEFSVAKKDTGGHKFSRWERIIKEARQQSGSKIATMIRQPLTMSELLDYWKKIKNISLGLLFHHLPENFQDKQSKDLDFTSLDLSSLDFTSLEKNSLHGYLSKDCEIVTLVVGPEGGFSDAEVSTFWENGFKLFTIGDTILRTETAALYCTAAVRIILLERDSWKLKQVITNNG